MRIPVALTTSASSIRVGDGRSRMAITVMSVRVLFAAAAGASLNHLERLFDAQRTTHLTRRIFLEGLKEAANESNGRHHCPKLLAPPTAVQHAFALIAL